MSDPERLDDDRGRLPGRPGRRRCLRIEAAEGVAIHLVVRGAIAALGIGHRVLCGAFFEQALQVRIAAFNFLCRVRASAGVLDPRRGISAQLGLECAGGFMGG